MTDITELAQSLKAAAENAGADCWQSKKISGDFYVIRKGSYKRKCGYTTYQPIAEIDHKPTRDYMTMASPANILAMVEALEKAQQRIAEMEEAEQKLCSANVTLDARAELAERQMVELGSRTVKLPKPKDSDPGWKIDPEFISKVQNAIGYDDQCECWEGTPSMEVVETVLLAAAGIKVEAE